MTRNLDLTGQRFGKLVVTGLVGLDQRGRLWSAQCDCGGTTVKPTGDLRRVRRAARSCGCGANDPRPTIWRHGHANTTRGQHPSKTYYSWQSMKMRCHKPTHKSYARYGGRGIFVCARWRDSFENFLADMGECPPGRSLDRINNDGVYEPGNCRWATLKEQNGNRRCVRLHDGMPLKEFARQQGVRYTTMLKWIGRGMTPPEAVAHTRLSATKPLPAPVVG